MDLQKSYEEERKRRLAAAKSIQQRDPRAGETGHSHDLWSRRQAEGEARIAAYQRAQARDLWRRSHAPGTPFPPELEGE